MNQELEPGIFCKTFGSTPQNQILEWFIEMNGIEYDCKQLQEYTGLPTKTVQFTVQQLVKDCLLKATRKSKGIQLYIFNRNHPLSPLLIAFDKAYVRKVIEEQTQKYPQKKTIHDQNL